MRRSRLGRALATSLAVAALGALLGACGGEGGPPVGNTVGALAPPLQGTVAAGGEAVRPGDGPRLVLFYRGWQCGLCRARLQQLREHLDAYRRAGIEVVAATPDGPEQLAQAAAALDSAFTLVGVDSATLQAWGVRPQTGGPPRPGAFLLDGRGVIRFRHVGRNAGDRVSDAELLTAAVQMRDSLRLR